MWRSTSACRVFDDSNGTSPERRTRVPPRCSRAGSVVSSAWPVPSCGSCTTKVEAGVPPSAARSASAWWPTRPCDAGRASAARENVIDHRVRRRLGGALWDARLHARALAGRENRRRGRQPSRPRLSRCFRSERGRRRAIGRPSAAARRFERGAERIVVTQGLEVGSVRRDRDFRCSARSRVPDARPLQRVRRAGRARRRACRAHGRCPGSSSRTRRRCAMASSYRPPLIASVEA